jgi:hypothetical protein
MAGTRGQLCKSCDRMKAAESVVLA